MYEITLSSLQRVGRQISSQLRLHLTILSFTSVSFILRFASWWRWWERMSHSWYKKSRVLHSTSSLLCLFNGCVDKIFCFVFFRSREQKKLQYNVCFRKVDVEWTKTFETKEQKNLAKRENIFTNWNFVMFSDFVIKNLSHCRSFPLRILRKQKVERTSGAKVKGCAGIFTFAPYFHLMSISNQPFVQLETHQQHLTETSGWKISKKIVFNFLFLRWRFEYVVAWISFGFNFSNEIRWENVKLELSWDEIYQTLIVGFNEGSEEKCAMEIAKPWKFKLKISSTFNFKWKFFRKITIDWKVLNKDFISRKKFHKFWIFNKKL